MTTLGRNSTIFSLLVFSVLSIVAHKNGIFEIQLDLLAPENHTVIYGSSSDNIEFLLDNADGTPEVSCQVNFASDNNYCSLTILTSEGGEFDKLHKGVDLSIYSSIDLDIRYSAPMGSPNMKVTLRNYDPRYVVAGDFASLKYNTFSFEPYHNNTFENKPFNNLKVEKWWLDNYQDQKDLSKIELDNIAFIEIFPTNVKHTNDYQFWVNNLTLKGQIISEPSLFIIILALWSTLIVYLVYQNTINLKSMAMTDLLSGCLNRRGLFDWTDSISRRKSACVFYIDIDDFKKVNEVHGNTIGDKVITELGTRIKRFLSTQYTVNHLHQAARIAGDGFAITFYEPQEKSIDELASNLLATIKEPFDFGTCIVQLTVSIGINFTEEHLDNFQCILDQANLAMSVAKRAGKNQIKLFDKHMGEDLNFRNHVSEIVKGALQNKEFYLNFMPICSTETSIMTRAEILLRSSNSELNKIGPEVYIPIAEEFNLIHDIDMWVIEEALKTISANQQEISINSIVFCINISALELNHNEFVTKTEHLLNSYAIDPKRIEFEITETSFIDVNAQSIETLNQVKELGVKLALDDFGTGYTAFSQLIGYPVSTLKIDRSFIQHLDLNNEVQVKLLKTILYVADAYGLETIGEGVETQEQLLFLKENGCLFAQGYFIAKPMAWDELKKRITNHPAPFISM